MGDRLTVHLPGGSQVQARATWDSRELRYAVRGGALTKVLGYIHQINLNGNGDVIPPQKPWVPASEKTLASSHVYQASTPDGTTLGEPVSTVEDAAALIVGHAHSGDPAPEHVVPET